MNRTVLLASILAISACAPTLDPKIKDTLIEAHSGTCIPTIQSQIAEMGLESQSNETTKEIGEYCSCLGHKYFDDFTIEDNQWVTTNFSLPPHIDATRSDYQMLCSRYSNFGFSLSALLYLNSQLEESISEKQDQEITSNGDEYVCKYPYVAGNFGIKNNYYFWLDEKKDSGVDSLECKTAAGTDFITYVCADKVNAGMSKVLSYYVKINKSDLTYEVSLIFNEGVIPKSPSTIGQCFKQPLMTESKSIRETLLNG